MQPARRVSGQQIAHRLELLLVGALPLVVWPGLTRPFSTPKLWILLTVGPVILLLQRRRSDVARSDRTTPLARALPFIWLCSWVLPSLFGEVVDFDRLLTAIAGGLWGAALLSHPRDPRALAVAAARGGTAVAAIAIAQWAGYDPFAWFGWSPQISGASVRMRVYATLGNPNFVAACLAVTLPVTAAVAFSMRRPSVRLSASAIVAIMIQSVALVATGSRAGALAVIAAGAVWTMCGGRARALVVLAAVAVAAVVIGVSQGRTLIDTISGRVSVWRVVARQAPFHLLTGVGPGGIEARFRDWQTAPQGKLPDQPASPADVHQHADNEFLGALVERGAFGLAAIVTLFVVPVVWVARRSAHQQPPLVSGALAALTAFAAVATVDEPLNRPAEAMLMWTAIAILRASLDNQSSLPTGLDTSGTSHV
jgi:putative inorganic carbon (HCO3(-)) transporter